MDRVVSGPEIGQAEAAQEPTLSGDGSPPPFRLRRRLLGIAAGLAAIGLFRLLAGRPELAEAVAGSPVLVGGVRTLSLATGIVPISLAELVVALVLLRQATGGLAGLVQIRRGEDRLLRALGRGGLRLAQDVGILVAVFVLLWGIQHTRPSLEERLGLEPTGHVSVEELEVLARTAVHAANDAYRDLHGSADSGVPTPVPSMDRLHGELNSAWQRVVERYGLPSTAASSRGSPKSFLTSSLVRRFGIAGMYFPFTGEALVLADLPGVLAPKEVAHEMAHQRGFASESDANALAFLVSRHARDPMVRYSGYVFLQGQLVGALAAHDPLLARALHRELLPGIVRDLEERRRYWAVARGWTRAVSVSLNDAMLKAHGVPDGIASYRGSTRVLVLLARERGPDELFSGLRPLPGSVEEPPLPGKGS